MPLETPFTFSQGNLQNFIDCRRRFQLRHIDRLAWPALQTEPAEAHEKNMLRGARFHKLAQQHHMGFPSEKLAASVRDPILAEWWANFNENYPVDLPAMKQVEVTLAAPVGEHRLVAKYDLLAFEPGGRFVIADWKTGGWIPPYDWLRDRMQTIVYRYVLVEAGASLNGGSPIDPASVEMIYWFANAPESPVRLPYDQVQHAAAGSKIEGLIGEISGLGENDFPLTEDLKQCKFCVYRSLCSRGETAGDLEEGGYLFDEEGLNEAAVESEEDTEGF